MQALSKVEDHVADALTKGARCVLGKPYNLPRIRRFSSQRCYSMPTPTCVFSGRNTGPVAALMPFDSEEEALRLANDTPFGLAAYVYTQNIAQALRVAEGLECSIGSQSMKASSQAEVAPFGGIKASGMGAGRLAAWGAGNMCS